MNLQTECLKRVPLTVDSVELFFQQRNTNFTGDLRNIVTALCLSHERLRAELEGATKLLSEEGGNP